MSHIDRLRSARTFLFLPRDHPQSRRLPIAGVAVEHTGARTFLTIEPQTLRSLAEEAFREISHLLRPAHLAQLRAIVDDPEASANDKFVAPDLLENAAISAGG